MAPVYWNARLRAYSSQFNELNPFWPYFAQLNGYITRVQYISEAGENIAAIALYRCDLAHGADEAPPTPKLNQAIMDAGYNYDHINADSLRHSTVREQMLVTGEERSTGRSFCRRSARSTQNWQNNW